ncbi:hypothetical protein SAMN04488056_10315 [Cohaesibacter marisflavi]|uniref:Uncharacterized protein n=1 Tax=Cohaesibacter marisflavi TaxID=655353 RepID=A0A1I5E4B0_9HYPH|nr:hypothetical protein [Cohaesibacter marisflavi]SFO06130.1 hypothetical protein SAMN04488056_10315 [Cohaesibacter marisflavi]
MNKQDLHELAAAYSAASNGRLINLMGLLLFLALAVTVDHRYFLVALVSILAVAAAYFADMLNEVSLMWVSVILTVVPFGFLLWLGVGL